MAKKNIFIGVVILVTVLNSVFLVLMNYVINNQAVAINRQGAALGVILQTPEIKGPVEAEVARLNSVK